MEMLVATTPEVRWKTICRAEFGLAPKELATLVAIATFCQVQEGMGMPRFELVRVAAKPDMDGSYTLCLAAAARLERLGLVEYVGYKERRSCRPTPEGWKRLRR